MDLLEAVRPRCKLFGDVPASSVLSPMRAAYLNQAVNLLVAILMVPLLLRYLDLNEYILWSIFTTFGAITLQFENAIQNASIRDIAREFHSADQAALEAAIRKARLAYRTLAASVLVPLCAFGLLYLNGVATRNLGRQANTEWMLFVLVYAVNYVFGTNNTIVLGMGSVDRFNNTTSLTRVLNFLCTYALLRAGLSIMGLCLSFACSVAIGCTMMALAARQLLREYGALAAQPDPDGKLKRSDGTNIIKYVLYSTASFVLYRGGLLVAAMVLPKVLAADYSLLLQAYAILSALALVPLQVWLRQLVGAIASRDRRRVLRQLAITIVTANGVFIVGSALLALFGNTLLLFIGSKVTLSSEGHVLLLGLAFIVEMNIAVLVNFLVTCNNGEFLGPYLATSIAGIVCGNVLPWIFPGSVIALVAAPLVLQGLFCLPILCSKTCSELGVTPAHLLTELGRLIVRWA